uniref:Uncharacterized protein n=1 Tax=Setaria italica TaxID=4555 RepID=K3YXN4_SETIT
MVPPRDFKNSSGGNGTGVQDPRRADDNGAVVGGGGAAPDLRAIHDHAGGGR